MRLISSDVKNLTVELFKQESDRDRQRKVGASQISDPCTKHLAYALVNKKEEPIKYWLGGKIGTAIHGFLEQCIDVSDNNVLADAVVERKIELGEIPGYGLVSSKPDLVLPSVHHLVDWKTTSRTKIKKLQNVVDGLKDDANAEYTLHKYIGQTQLYAWGLNNSGTKIEDISLVFINRDGTYENDIWVFTIPYDEATAVALWDRVTKIWQQLQEGKLPDEFPNHPECFKCNLGI